MGGVDPTLPTFVTVVTVVFVVFAGVRENARVSERGRGGRATGSTVARQILVLQLLVVLVVVLGALALAYAEVRRSTLAGARDRAVGGGRRGRRRAHRPARR